MFRSSLKIKTLSLINLKQMTLNSTKPGGIQTSDLEWVTLLGRVSPGGSSTLGAVSGLLLEMLSLSPFGPASCCPSGPVRLWHSLWLLPKVALPQSSVPCHVYLLLIVRVCRCVCVCVKYMILNDITENVFRCLLCNPKKKVLSTSKTLNRNSRTHIQVIPE